MKKILKVFEVIIAASIMLCATTTSSSALCLYDIFELNGNSNITTLIQCLRSGKCNITDLYTSEFNCQNGNCNNTFTQEETEFPTSSDVSTTKSDVQAVFNLVNKERKANGLDTLILSEDLCKVADIRAKEIVKSFSHTRPNGTTCFTAFKENGITYRYAGENIAAGQKTAVKVMTGWMNSPGHRANILKKDFKKIGIACYEINNRKYWVQLFTN